MKPKRAYLLTRYDHPVTHNIGVFMSEATAKTAAPLSPGRVTWVYWADRNVHEGKDDVTGALFYINEVALFPEVK